MSWELEELLEENKARLEGLEEVIGSYHDITESYLNPHLSPNDKVADWFSSAPIAITITAELIVELIKNRKR